ESIDRSGSDDQPANAGRDDPPSVAKKLAHNILRSMFAVVFELFKSPHNPLLASLLLENYVTCRSGALMQIKYSLRASDRVARRHRKIIETSSIRPQQAR
ncbi:MAG TPA: hypothetical protein VK337_03040, partial [Xanthobacteraceae bacterium]|nr:hypothetical protein [Xanthobacteraceae bacterium]